MMVMIELARNMRITYMRRLLATRAQAAPCNPMTGRRRYVATITANEAMMVEKDWYEMDVITCAAPDLRQLGDAAQFSPTMEELRTLHEHRWRCILAVAAQHEADVLILGAFGCGVFANPPVVVVEAFNNVLPEFRNHFETIEFAVYTARIDSPNYRGFRCISDIQENKEKEI